MRQYQEKLCVVGAGPMGRQIALQAALSGYEVWLNDSQHATLERADKWVRHTLSAGIENGKMCPDRAEMALQRLHLSENLEEAAADAARIIAARAVTPEARERLLHTLTPRAAGAPPRV